MATYELANSIPSTIVLGDILNCSYSGTYKSVNLPAGVYKLEVWGAEGGTYSTAGGRGGYSYGTLRLSETTTVHIYTGGAGTGANTSGGFNGGGRTNNYGGSGGGGSDIRIGSTSLYARVIVAGGGGGAGYSTTTGGYGGGTTGGQGGNGSATGGYGGTQTQGGTNNTSGSFGTANSNTSNGGGGGGGWYGGSSGIGSGTDTGGGGGSGYIYTSTTYTNYPSGCLLNSNHYLTDSSTIAGNASFTSPYGYAETGHTGHGYVRITFIASANKAPNSPTISTPKSTGYVVNRRCPIIVNVPSDEDGNNVKIRAILKNGSSEICQIESGFVTQGVGTVILTPTVDLPIATITVILDAYDGTAWSTTSSSTFIVSNLPSFTVVASDVNISKTNMDNLKTLLSNVRKARNLDETDAIGTINKNATAITKSHLDIMRTKTNEVLTLLNITPTWTDPVIVSGQTLRKGTHWIEIFNYLKQC